MDDNHQAQPSEVDQAEQKEALEPLQPDDSQALNLVADEDAAEYEGQQTGVCFSFILQCEEFYEVFRRQESHSPAYKRKIHWLMPVGTVVVVCLVLGIAMSEEDGRLLRIALLGALAGFFV